MKLTFPILNTTITVPIDDSIVNSKMSRRSLRKKLENRIVEQIEKMNETDAKSPERTTEKPLDSRSHSNSQPILMVEVVNITHEKFKQTEEIKVQMLLNKILYIKHDITQ